MLHNVDDSTPSEQTQETLKRTLSPIIFYRSYSSRSELDQDQPGH